jgi:sarcosine oxidase delta subunit
MAWWTVAREYLTANASVYIWGNVEDLWRLWYVGGLQASERLTLRNEIVWDKSTGQGMESEWHRMYPTATERCLFFMRGEQGFNINADNYWDGWEPIRRYLKAERDKMGWDISTCKILVGHSPMSGCHWFDASQWMMPTREVYEAWQHAAGDKAFKQDYDKLKQDYDKLKQDYDATRAYFDNTHDSMTDVWAFPRVSGIERFDFPTPKPVVLISRIIRSSTPPAAVVYDPFLGSGTTIIACEQNGRLVRGLELNEENLAICLERCDNFGLEPRLVES